MRAGGRIHAHHRFVPVRETGDISTWFRFQLLDEALRILLMTRSRSVNPSDSPLLERLWWPAARQEGEIEHEEVKCFLSDLVQSAPLLRFYFFFEHTFWHLNSVRTRFLFHGHQKLMSCWSGSVLSLDEGGGLHFCSSISENDLDYCGREKKKQRGRRKSF